MGVSNYNKQLAQLKSKIAQLEARELKYLARIAELEKTTPKAGNNTYREDMKADGKIDVQNISPNMAKQMMKSFEENFDNQVVKNILDLEQREGADNPEVKDYKAALAIYTKLKKKYK